MDLKIKNLLSNNVQYPNNNVNFVNGSLGIKGKYYGDESDFEDQMNSEKTDIGTINSILQNRLAIFNNIEDIDLLDSQINNLDISFGLLLDAIETISGGSEVLQLLDLCNNFYEFKNTFDNFIEFNLDNSYIFFNHDICLNSRIYNFNNESIYDLNNVDNSNNIVLNLRQLNELLKEYTKIEDLSKIAQDLTNNFIFEESGENVTYLHILKDVSVSGIITSNSDLSYEAIAQSDNSSSIILNLKQINQLIDSKDFSTGGENNGPVITASGGLEYVNDVSQTFYQIMTQQPHTFDGSGIPTKITTSTITLTWNYDNIIAKHNIEGYNARLAFLNNNKQQQLPYINKLVFEISGNVGEIPTGWINLLTMNIPDSVSYDQKSYKEYNLQKHTDEVGSPGTADYFKNSIISSLNNFDLRIYGSNFSNEIPSIDKRSLYFYNITFLSAQPPSQPNFISESINSNLKFTLTYNVSFTENNQDDSDAVLNGYIIDYSENETKASIIYPVVITDLSSSDSLSNIGKEQNFDISINGLRSGSTYNYSLAVKNDLNNSSYSEYSDSRTSDYTLLPESRGIQTTLNLGIKDTYTNVSTHSSKGLNNSRVLYINLSISQSITPSITSNQTIEISNPMINNNFSQQNDTYGYGKYIDNSLNLVSLTVSVNDVSKQKITFDGSFSRTTGNEEKLNSNTFDYISLAELPENSLQDIWNGNISNQGFRLKGLLKLNSISNSNVLSEIGVPSTNPYVLKYTYERNNDVGGSDQIESHNIYVDDLSLNPVITGSNSSNVNKVLYNFGIPSVQRFNLSFNRTYSNINSAQGFIPGDKIIADIQSIASTSADSIMNISLLVSEINSSGTYSFNDTQFNNLNYTSSRLTAGSNNNLSWSERVYSLLKPNGITNSLSHTTNHYVDYASFSKSGTEMINTNIINLANVHVYELSNISLIGSNLGTLGLTHYTKHEVQMQEYSLLHINNKFQSNGSQTYPAIGDFSYNGEIINDFSDGLISYDLNGNKTGDNSGYKYIAFRLYKSGNTAYTFNNSTYNLQTNLDNVKYLNLKTILTQNSIFYLDDVNNIFDENSNDAIGFVRVTRTDDSVVLIGNLKQSFNPTGGNWNVNGSPASISYNDSLQLKYGAKVIDGTNYGLYVSPTAINDDLTIFIGIKNI